MEQFHQEPECHKIMHSTTFFGFILKLSGRFILMFYCLNVFLRVKAFLTAAYYEESGRRNDRTHLYGHKSLWREITMIFYSDRNIIWNYYCYRGRVGLEIVRSSFWDGKYVKNLRQDVHFAYTCFRWYKIWKFVRKSVALRKDVG